MLSLDTIKVIFLKLDRQVEIYHCYLLQLPAYQICDILGLSFQSSIQTFSCMTLRNINRADRLNPALALTLKKKKIKHPVCWAFGKDFTVSR